MTTAVSIITAETGRAAVHAVASRLYRLGITVVDIHPQQNLLTVKDGSGETFTIRVTGRTKGHFQFGNRAEVQEASAHRAWVFVSMDSDGDSFYILPGSVVADEVTRAMLQPDPYPHGMANDALAAKVLDHQSRWEIITG